VLDYDREAERYDATRGGDARADAAAAAIETLLEVPLPFRVVDVGCGTGIVTVRLVRPGRSVTGIERSAGMAAVAAGRLPGRIALGDASRLPLASGSADVVTMVWLLHLLSHTDSAAALAEAGRVLRPGGLLITTVGKDGAFYGEADDAAAVLAPVRAAFDREPADGLDQVLDIGRRAGLELAGETTFVGVGQGMSPGQWRRRLRHGDIEWVLAAGAERLDGLYAAIEELPDQDRARPDPVYRLVALRLAGR
jgi:SAM-dependent methyltransferase